MSGNASCFPKGEIFKESYTMRDKIKRIIGFAMASAMTLTTVALAGCSEKNYEGKKLEGFDASAEVTSNGGFVAQKGDYVYFINGHEDYTATNEYGEVTKGALLRIKESDLKAKSYDKTDVVVPMLFVAQNFDAGIYLYGDRVYFATPTTDKDLDGNTENTWIDFKSAKLDGTETMKGNYFRLGNNAVQYRFVEVEGVVYCMYVQDGTLYSYNTATDVTTTLVKGAETYYFDETDTENANVYYSMKVTSNIDSDNATELEYNQIYMVNAAATATTNDGSYTVKDEKGTAYRTYSFKKSFMEEKNKEAKDAETEEPYNLKDYATYPYVNLGKLVLDGLGSSDLNKLTQYNDGFHKVDAGEADTSASFGYTYTLQSYENGGLYFTRKNNNSSVAASLYYVANTQVADTNWKSLVGNADLTVVTTDTTNATKDAVYYIENGQHGYLYLANDKINKAEYNATTKKLDSYAIVENAAGATLWTIEGNYLYYYNAGTNGNNLSRVGYKSNNKLDYNLGLGDEEYNPTTIGFIDWNSGWYKPEFVGDVLLFSNAQSIGDMAYNYIYAFDFAGKNATALNELVEEYDDAKKALTDLADGDSDVQKVLNYIFQAGETAEYDAIKDSEEEYFDDDQKALIQSYVEDTEALRQNDFMGMVGKVSADDAKMISEAWATSITPVKESEETTTEDDGLETWQIVLIVVSGVIVLAGIAGGIVYFVMDAKKKKAKAQEEADTVNRYKNKIDVKDDKSIDVYADGSKENAEEATEEKEEVEENAEEVSEEVSEETEVVEEAVEESVVETAEEPVAETTETTEEPKKE